MSIIKYGLISETDAMVLEKTIDLICNDFTDNEICVTEIGLFDCGTVNGLSQYITEKKSRIVYYTGIDNEKDKPIIAPPELHYINGNSNEVYNQIEDNSQHLVFQDANHSYPMTISDFFCYEGKVKRGGFYALHDTGAHIRPKTSYQRMGSIEDEDMYISCRKAIKRIGLLDNKFDGWELVFDEADILNEMGGIVVLRKL